MTKNYLRWLVVFLVFIATGLSFLDRQVLSIAVIKIQKEFGFTDVEYGWVNTSFLLSYALMFTVGGRLIDQIGAKKGLGIAVGLWSVANALHGVMTSLPQLLTFRFFLGMGEGACFPGAAKTVYEWFDEKERALANGIAIGGSAIGAVIAPPLTIWISNAYGWRAGFVVPGLIGIAWVFVWLAVPWRSQAAIAAPAVQAAAVPLRAILRQRATWVFILMRFMLDPVMYFMMFWIPKYLAEVRHVPFEQIGNLFWIPFLALGVSNILGGYFSDSLIRRNISTDRARKIVMGCAAALTLAVPLTEFTTSLAVAVGLMALYMFAHGCWITNYITAISDVFGSRATSTVVGLSGTAGALSSLILNPMIGKIIAGYTYKPLWIASGLLYPIAFAAFISLIPRLLPLLNKAEETVVAVPAND
ncbi:MFS transporter [Dyadobacter jiangsuensis]|uniref:ACS family hexuronate transporter-like MFS transporter n=1 Tax=Dyadobacter jiangsuensis TaxID=1591085 RepID=A0A2P8GIK6_9BACT|nr:MFS transporter [Dyadobacter jiangsuensis]PSL33809.1 ACS family hexuronate transporter-like MFS transporter [Dyadobacter jiangsuensis]